LIFDFDGTLADSFETLLNIFNEISGRPKNLTTHEVLELRGKSFKDVVRYLKIKPWQIPPLILKAKRLAATKIDKVPAFAGVPQTLKQLNQSGHEMFIVSTNSTANIEKFLKNIGAESYFMNIYGDIGLRSKSSAIKKIIRKEKLNRHDCFYIGDEVRDIEAAQKAGVSSIGVTWGFNTPEAIKRATPLMVARSPKDLIKYFN